MSDKLGKASRQGRMGKSTVDKLDFTKDSEKVPPAMPTFDGIPVVEGIPLKMRSNGDGLPPRGVVVDGWTAAAAAPMPPRAAPAEQGAAPAGGARRSRFGFRKSVSDELHSACGPDSAGTEVQQAAAQYKKARTIREMLEARRIFQRATAGASEESSGPGGASSDGEDDAEHEEALRRAVAELRQARTLNEMGKSRQKILDIGARRQAASSQVQRPRAAASSSKRDGKSGLRRAERTAAEVETRALGSMALHAWHAQVLKEQNHRLEAEVSRSRAKPAVAQQGGIMLSVELDAARIGDAKSFDRSFLRELACTVGLPEKMLTVQSVREHPVEVDFSVLPCDSRPSTEVLDALRGALGAEEMGFLVDERRHAKVKALHMLVPSAHGLRRVPLEARRAGDDAVDRRESEENRSQHSHRDQSATSPASDDHRPTCERPEYWGLKVSELADFHDEIKSDMEEYCQAHWLTFSRGQCVHVCKEGAKCKYGDHNGCAFSGNPSEFSQDALKAMVPNMHIVVARYVKRLTLGCGKSFALMKRPEGIKISHFVTHTWEEEFSDFIWTLQAALGPDDVVWVCSFALNQNANIQQAIGGELIDCPFAVALRQAVKQLVVLDKDLVVPRRSWCSYELSIAGQFAIPTFLWPHRNSDMSQLKSQVDALDMRDAQATKKDDEARIRGAIEASDGGFEKLNGRLRNVLSVTLRFYAEAASQVADLTRLVDEARAQGDQASLQAYEQARLSELRRLEAAETAQQQKEFLEERCADLEKEAQALRQRLAEAGSGPVPPPPPPGTFVPGRMPGQASRRSSPVGVVRGRTFGCAWFRRLKRGDGESLSHE